MSAIISRRSALALPLVAAAAGGAERKAPPRRERRKLGMYAVLRDDPEGTLAQVRSLGLSLFEIYNDNFDPAMADRLVDAMKKNGIQPVALFSMGPGEMVWDFDQGPSTIGLVPRRYRDQRILHLKYASEFAKRCGIPAVETHCGFIPEDPHDPLYRETVNAIREVASYCRDNGQTFLYHSGQETPVTQLRAIEDVGLDNQGIGLDTANLILYGKGHPTEALDIYGSHLRLVNAKDGLYPKNAQELGKEVPIGQGRVDFPRFLRKLDQIGYKGPVLIEREISGPQMLEDVRKAKAYLQNLLQ